MNYYNQFDVTLNHTKKNWKKLIKVIDELQLTTN